MKWNPFSLISLGIDKTKERVWPFKLKEWLRLLVMFILSGSAGSNSNFNYRGGGNYNTGSVSETDLTGFFSDAKRFLRENMGFFGVIFILFSILGTIITYISSVFSFILLESLITKNSKFTFRKNQAKGFSLFGFIFVVDLIAVCVLLALASPYLYYFYKGYPLLSLGLGYIISSIVIAVLFLIALGIWLLFLDDFVVPLMYVKEIPALAALKEIWRYIFKNKLETFVYFLSRIVLSIAIGVASIIIAVISLLAFALAGLIIFLVLLLLYKIIGLKLLFVTLGIILGIALFVLWLLGIALVTMPLLAFSKYFSLLNFEKLTGIKILNFKPKPVKLKLWSRAKRITVVLLVVFGILLFLCGILGYAVYHFA